MNDNQDGLQPLLEFLTSLEHAGNTRLLQESRFLLGELDSVADPERFHLLDSASHPTADRIVTAVAAVTGRQVRRACGISAANPLALTPTELCWLRAGRIRADVWATLFEGERVGFCPWVDAPKELWLPLIQEIGDPTWHELHHLVSNGFCARLQAGLRRTIAHAPWQERERGALERSLGDLILLWLGLVLVGDQHRVDLVRPSVDFLVQGCPPFAWSARDRTKILYLVA